MQGGSATQPRRGDLVEKPFQGFKTRPVCLFPHRHQDRGERPQAHLARRRGQGRRIEQDAATFPFPRGGQVLTPEAALNSLPQKLAGTHVLNEYGFGGYLIFRGVRPFIDSRAELYGDAFLNDYARIVAPDAKALGSTVEKYHIGWTIFPPESPVVAVLDLLPGWHRLYTDDVAVVHIRDANPKR